MNNTIVIFENKYDHFRKICESMSLTGRKIVPNYIKEKIIDIKATDTEFEGFEELRKLLVTFATNHDNEIDNTIISNELNNIIHDHNSVHDHKNVKLFILDLGLITFKNENSFDYSGSILRKYFIERFYKNVPVCWVSDYSKEIIVNSGHFNHKLDLYVSKTQIVSNVNPNYKPLDIYLKSRYKI